MMIKRKEKGYSIVEILVAVSIMGILFATATPVFIEMQRKAAISSLYSDVSATVVETTVYQNFDLDNSLVLNEEKFNSYKTETQPNIITLHVFTTNTVEYCIQGERNFADIGTTYLSYNMSVKEYQNTPCMPSQE